MMLAKRLSSYELPLRSKFPVKRGVTYLLAGLLLCVAAETVRADLVEVPEQVVDHYRHANFIAAFRLSSDRVNPSQDKTVNMLRKRQVSWRIRRVVEDLVVVDEKMVVYGTDRNRGDLPSGLAGRLVLIRDASIGDTELVVEVVVHLLEQAQKELLVAEFERLDGDLSRVPEGREAVDFLGESVDHVERHHWYLDDGRWYRSDGAYILLGAGGR